MTDNATSDYGRLAAELADVYRQLDESNARLDAALAELDRLADQMAMTLDRYRRARARR